MSEFSYNKDNFLLNGKPFVVRAGSMHYFRIPSAYWKDRLLKLKECGFNTVETYIAWNLHEPEEKKYDFDGELDICKFIKIADELGLKVMLRIGPFICAEFEGGGLPHWLLKYKGIRLRTRDPIFMEKTERWLQVLFNHIRSTFIGNGGNVIIAQVENEYASFGNDSEYIKSLVKIFQKNDVKCLLCTADGGDDYYLSGVLVDEVATFANFGSQTEENMDRLKNYHPNQPPFCAEFWCGWFDHWHEQHHLRSAESIVKEVEPFIRNDWSFNIYMFCGGTNFGFYNGANYHDGVYRPVVTSYDYCALLTESGDRTEAYYKVRDLIEKSGVNVPAVTAVDSKKIAYGTVNFSSCATLFENLDVLGNRYKSDEPQSMEDLGQAYGYIVYSTVAAGVYENAPLSIEGLADRATIFINHEKVGVYERGREYENICITAKGKIKIDILVENCGRVNFGPYLYDRKGISGVRLGSRYLFGWEMYTLKYNDFFRLRFDVLTEEISSQPCFYRGKFFVDEVADTFLRLDGFGKGFAVVNGHNLGRYYTAAGPQKTLYVPACYLREGNNELIVFDGDGATELNAEFVDKPEL